jgi:hypothetical protein
LSLAAGIGHESGIGFATIPGVDFVARRRPEAAAPGDGPTGGRTMIRRNPSRLVALALAGGTLGFSAGPALCLAQDGQPETEGPVTRPGTTEQVPDVDPTNPPRTTDELLPPVPASVVDPAPPGTRAVPPGAVGHPGVRSPLTPSQAAEARARQLQGINRIEGVVIAIEKPEGDAADSSKPANAKVRLIIDPSQSWEDFAASGPLNIAEDQKGPTTSAPPAEGDDADAKANPLVEAAAAAVRAADRKLNDADTRADEPKDVEGAAAPATSDRQANIPVLVTARTHVFVHARSEDGTDLFHMATASSPRVRPDGVAVKGRASTPPPGPMETNFTNIHVGSFVSIRYRAVGDVNQAVNLNLIELPILPPGDAARIRGLEPVPAGNAGVNGIPTDEGAAPARVPAVPGQPVSPGGSIPR